MFFARVPAICDTQTGMESSLVGLFLDYSARKLEQLSGRIQDCLARLPESEIWRRGGENQNAPGNLILHLCGNVRQWIGSGVGGLADIRERDLEFAARGGLSTAELAAKLHTTMAEMIAIIRNLPPERLVEKTTIQGYEQTKFEAILHVVEHFSYHAGQILFITKLVTGEDLGYYRHLATQAHAEKTP
jgi:uncharacterized damage-inducible protein DinB